MNKRGQESSSPTGALIPVLIGVAVLVIILIFAFPTLRDQFSKIFGFSGSGSNVGDTAAQCATYCNLAQQYEFCTQTREVTFGSDISAETASCNDFATKDNLKTKTGGAIKECPSLCVTA